MTGPCCVVVRGVRLSPTFSTVGVLGSRMSCSAHGRASLEEEGMDSEHEDAFRCGLQRLLLLPSRAGVRGLGVTSVRA